MLHTVKDDWIHVVAPPLGNKMFFTVVIDSSSVNQHFSTTAFYDMAGTVKNVPQLTSLVGFLSIRSEHIKRNRILW